MRSIPEKCYKCGAPLTQGKSFNALECEYCGEIFRRETSEENDFFEDDLYADNQNERREGEALWEDSAAYKVIDEIKDWTGENDKSD